MWTSPPRAQKMQKLEAFLPDDRVTRIQEALYKEHPELRKYPTDLATARIEPPWHGKLPDGRVGWARHPVIQFIIASDHPRPIQRKAGARHVTRAIVWQQAFEDAEREKKFYVDSERVPTEERIFRGMLPKHLWDLDRLSRIQNDAIGHPSGLKSAFEAL